MQPYHQRGQKVGERQCCDEGEQMSNCMMQLGFGAKSRRATGGNKE